MTPKLSAAFYEFAKQHGAIRDDGLYVPYVMDSHTCFMLGAASMAEIALEGYASALEEIRQLREQLIKPPHG